MRTPAMVLVAMALTGSSTAAAQRREASGLWYSVGVAPGWARVTCYICAGRRKTALSAVIGVGGSAGRAVRIGAELAAWRQREGGVTQTVMSFGATAYWYPNAGRRFYLRAAQLRPVLDGLGISIISTSKGVMSDRRARAQRLGGEVLCKVW